MSRTVSTRTIKRLVRRYRRSKKARVMGFNPWYEAAEPGDLMVDHRGRLFRLESPSSFYARSAGILYPREVRPPRSGILAEIHDGEVWWAQPNAGLEPRGNRVGSEPLLADSQDGV